MISHVTRAVLIKFVPLKDNRNKKVDGLFNFSIQEVKLMRSTCVIKSVNVLSSRFQAVNKVQTPRAIINQCI